MTKSSEIINISHDRWTQSRYASRPHLPYKICVQNDPNNKFRCQQLVDSQRFRVSLLVRRHIFFLFLRYFFIFVAYLSLSLSPIYICVFIIELDFILHIILLVLFKFIALVVLLFIIRNVQTNSNNIKKQNAERK